MLKYHHLCFSIAADLLSLVCLLHCVCQIIPSAATLNPSSLVCWFFGWHMCFPLHMYHIDLSLFPIFVLVCECIADSVCVRPSKRQTRPPKVEWWYERQIRASSGLIRLLFSQGTQTELLSPSASLSLCLSLSPSPSLSVSLLLSVFRSASLSLSPPHSAFLPLCPLSLSISVSPSPSLSPSLCLPFSPSASLSLPLSLFLSHPLSVSPSASLCLWPCHFVSSLLFSPLSHPLPSL